MSTYNSMQIKFICCYARRLRTDRETAAKRWVSKGLAEKFCHIYAKLQNLAK